MFLRCPSKSASSLVALFLLLTTGAGAEVPLRICAEPDNLPMSQKSTNSGFEIEAAQLLAKDMGRTLEVKWVPQRDHSFFRQTIGKGECDAIMSLPAQFGRLTMTQPWYRTGFMFVTRKEDNIAPHSFDDETLKKLSIGVPATGLGDTPPIMALTQRGMAANLRPYSIYEPQKLIDAVAKKEIDMAIVSSPFAGWYGGQQNLALTPTPERDGMIPFAFDMAIGVRKGNEALKEQLNRALEHQHAAIAAVFDHWHVPFGKDK
ncbi:MAG: extracellular solute-binding protein family 3 [Alphaproteobacteria bacterium]|nr:extracellular solute-binding protein family 3 [Alphaproteobacteria bacterium]